MPITMTPSYNDEIALLYKMYYRGAMYVTLKLSPENVLGDANVLPKGGDNPKLVMVSEVLVNLLSPT